MHSYWELVAYKTAYIHTYLIICLSPAAPSHHAVILINVDVPCNSNNLECEVLYIAQSWDVVVLLCKHMLTVSIYCMCLTTVCPWLRWLAVPFCKEAPMLSLHACKRRVDCAKLSVSINLMYAICTGAACASVAV